MQRMEHLSRRTSCRPLLMAIALFAASPSAALAGPFVEFDFARIAECRDVTPPERLAEYPHQRLVEFTLPVSVRFHGVPFDDVEEIHIEINGAGAGLRIHDFAPATQLASDIVQEVERVTTTKSARSLDATLGGALPVPYADVAARVTPSITAGASSGDQVTEKVNRLPPKRPIVVSGTMAEGRGVFFKLKPSTQTSLEGVHELTVTSIVPAGWRGGEVRVACSARGQRKTLWIKQSATLGRQGDVVRLYLTAPLVVRHVAKPVEAESPAPVVRQATFLEAAAAGVMRLVREANDAKSQAEER